MAKINDYRFRFGRTDRHTESQTRLDVSLIAADMRVTGDLHSGDVVTVAGTVLGEVTAADQVIVMKGGRVAGDVEAREVVLCGVVHGSVDASERLEIRASAVVLGDLHAPRLSVQAGAVVDGALSMAKATIKCERGAA